MWELVCLLNLKQFKVRILLCILLCSSICVATLHYGGFVVTSKTSNTVKATVIDAIKTLENNKEKCVVYFELSDGSVIGSSDERYFDYFWLRIGQLVEIEMVKKNYSNGSSRETIRKIDALHGYQLMEYDYSCAI